MQDPIIYTNATFRASRTPGIVDIYASDVLNDIVLILTEQEMMDGLKSWLRQLPVEKRQMFIDELREETTR